MLIYDPSRREIRVEGGNAKRQSKSFHDETALLISLLRRMGEYAAAVAGGGVSISCYSFGTKNRAALEVARMGERLEIPDEETDV